MNVIHRLIVFLASSMPVLSFPPVTDPPSSCTCGDGTKISLGESHKVNDCDICYCDENGDNLIHGDCFFVECWDSVDKNDDGRCCPICPNGKNCGVVNGSYGVFQLIPHGETINFGHATCSCDIHKSNYEQRLPIADCVLHESPIPTTPPLTPPPPPPSTTTPPVQTTPALPTTPPPTHPPPPGCECSDNTIIAIGSSHRIHDCLRCECDEIHGVQYVMENCSRITCVDYKDVKGDDICCPECPNGNNCQAEVGHGTTIIPDGQTVVLNGFRCACDVSNQANTNSFYPKATCEKNS